MQVLLRTQADETEQDEPNLVLGLVTTPEELEQVQRLRFDVYTTEMNAVFPDAVDGVDIDRFDQWCDHLMVCDSKTNKVVGTYRIMTPENAVKAKGYYSESEFDISSLNDIRHLLCECGRSCTHADYRNGAAIMMLWTGLTKYLYSKNYRYMLGCASVSLADGGVQASQVWRAARAEMDKHPELPQVKPLNPYPLEKLTCTDDAKIPPLIKGYLKIGARICGEPAWDPDFNAADFPIIIDMESMDPRYRKHFLG
ncbi:MAG: GNAT family N-acetyltransferase [Alcaligenaceae bacterium]|nr:GNAT family N-acetyltransferase [Alcaligenaceae bacterium]